LPETVEPSASMIFRTPFSNEATVATASVGGAGVPLLVVVVVERLAKTTVRAWWRR
jgi:hypothetical protein